MLRRNGLVIKSVEPVVRPEGSLWWERSVKEVGLELGVKERESYGWWEWWVDRVRRCSRSIPVPLSETEGLEWGWRRELGSWLQRYWDKIRNIRYRPVITCRIKNKITITAGNANYNHNMRVREPIKLGLQLTIVESYCVIVQQLYSTRTHQEMR